MAASPFDAALHDAFGKAHGLNCFSTYGPDFMSHDLSHYLGAEFKGETLDRYVLKKAKPRMPLYHLVGALDPLTDADVAKPLADGLPETLAEWIPFNGLTHLKIKLNGDDLNWDVQRVIGVNRVAEIEQAKRGVATWFYSLDFNEKCANVGYLLEFLHKVKELTPAGFERIQYIEQPTKRNLKSDRANVMHEASKLPPPPPGVTFADANRCSTWKAYAGDWAKEMATRSKRAQGVQGTKPEPLDGCGRDQGWHVSVRAGLVVSRSVAAAIGEHRRARAGNRRHRVEFAAILPGRE